MIYLRDTLNDVRYTSKKDMLKNSIKKLYNKDRSELIDICSLVIADLKKVTYMVILNLGKIIKNINGNPPFLIELC